MSVLLLIAGLSLLLVVLVVRDQNRLRDRRSVERGLHIVSKRASHRLQFRRPIRSDRDFYVEMASDPDAVVANGWSPHEVAAVRARFDDKQAFMVFRESEVVAFEREKTARTERPLPERFNRWVQRTTAAVFGRPEPFAGTLVGTATFSTSPLDSNIRSIGVHVHPHHRNQGYGQEIMAAAILLMQYTPGPIHVGTHVDNDGMQQIMQNLGYQPEPDPQSYIAPDGNEYLAHWYHCGVEVHPPAGLLDLP